MKKHQRKVEYFSKKKNQFRLEEKVPEKPREKIFQRNQVTEPPKKIVYVGDLEQNLNKGRKQGTILFNLSR